MAEDPIKRLHKLMTEMVSVVEKITEEPAPAQPATHTNQKKLTKRDAMTIRQLKRNGMSQREIADAFDINRATVSRIVRGIYHK